MTAKQALREYIEELSEEEAATLWDRLQDEEAEESFGPLTDDDIASVRRGIEDIGAGRFYTTEEVRRRLGLAD